MQPRIVTIKTSLKSVVTKADLTLMETSLVKWMLGTIGAALPAGSLVVQVLMK